jgi:hypothetical protein
MTVFSRKGCRDYALGWSYYRFSSLRGDYVANTLYDLACFGARIEEVPSEAILGSISDSEFNLKI